MHALKISISCFLFWNEKSVKPSFFLFNIVYYKQIDGVVIDSPLGSTLANLFLTYYEDR